MTPPYYDAAMVDALLDYPGCIAAMRAAMMALSTRDTVQPLRQIVEVGPGRRFGVMPGALTGGAGGTGAEGAVFGAKLVSVFDDPARPGRSRHQGVVVGYDGVTGAVSCIADAEAVTRIRTGGASAAATDALARSDAKVLAVFGTGTQAESHIRAIACVRPLREVRVWGRSLARAEALAARLAPALGLPIMAVADGRDAAAADIICTTTSASTPVLLGDWVRPGTHINVVGSSYLGPVEVDTALVTMARYFADYRPGVLAQASELAAARDAGLLDDGHVVGEIGAVFAGTLEGREHPDQITLYKSLGHVVQDLAATAYLQARAPSGD